MSEISKHALENLCEDLMSLAIDYDATDLEDRHDVVYKLALVLQLGNKSMKRRAALILHGGGDKSKNVLDDCIKGNKVDDDTLRFLGFYKLETDE